MADGSGEKFSAYEWARRGGDAVNTQAFRAFAKRSGMSVEVHGSDCPQSKPCTCKPQSD